MNIIVTHGSKKGYAAKVGEGLSIGRDTSNRLVLDDPRISRIHAKIEKQNDQYVLLDLDSSNGTYVNGRLVSSQILKEGDEILLGAIRLKILSEGVVTQPQTQEEVKIVREEGLPQAQVARSIDPKRSTFIDVSGGSLKIEHIDKAARSLSILYKSVNVFNEIQDEEALLGKVLDLVMEVVKADRYVIMLRDEKTKELVPKIIRRAAQKPGYFPIAISQSIVDTVLNEHVGVICAHAAEDDRFKESESVYIYGIKSAMCVPVSSKDHVSGLIYCDSLNRTSQFNEDDLKLLTAIAIQASSALDNARLYHEFQGQERLKHELLIAREIQQILLPQTFPHLDGFDISFRSLAAEEVGGDYYDWFWIDDERLALVIADVSGKGVPGALVMAMFRSTLKSRALGSKNTASLLREVNNLLIADMRQDMFISCSLVFLNVKDHQLSFSRAGHLPLIIFRGQNGKCEEFAPQGLALGFSRWEDPCSIEEVKIQLERGDHVFFYTDGVVEAQDRHQEHYGHERFLKTLKTLSQVVENQDAHRIVQNILEGIRAYAQGAPQSDDITLGMLRVK